MPPRDVNAATRLAEASWRRDKCANRKIHVHHLSLPMKSIAKMDIKFD